MKKRVNPVSHINKHLSKKTNLVILGAIQYVSDVFMATANIEDSHPKEGKVFISTSSHRTANCVNHKTVPFVS